MKGYIHLNKEKRKIMITNIESYNSSYPLAYYEIGKVYIFYGKKTSIGEVATSDQIKMYSSVLKELDEKEDSSIIKAVKNIRTSEKEFSRSFNRFYAVVVDKINGKNPKIVVMFLNRGGEETFLIRSYAVNFGCNTDGMDLMPVSTSVNIQKRCNKIGGITKVKTETKNIVGGITRIRTKTESSIIGGITRVNREIEIYNEKSKVELHNENSASHVGGVTRVKKVGGITRVRRN